MLVLMVLCLYVSVDGNVLVLKLNYYDSVYMLLLSFDMLLNFI